MSVPEGFPFPPESLCINLTSIHVSDDPVNRSTSGFLRLFCVSRVSVLRSCNWSWYIFSGSLFIYVHWTWRGTWVSGLRTTVVCQIGPDLLLFGLKFNLFSSFLPCFWQTSSPPPEFCSHFSASSSTDKYRRSSKLKFNKLNIQTYTFGSILWFNSRSLNNSPTSFSPFEYTIWIPLVIYLLTTHNFFA